MCSNDSKNYTQARHTLCLSAYIKIKKYLQKRLGTKHVTKYSKAQEYICSNNLKG
jgi:hypothetical protein